MKEQLEIAIKEAEKEARETEHKFGSLDTIKGASQSAFIQGKISGLKCALQMLDAKAPVPKSD